jgi:hypothetical protein
MFMQNFSSLACTQTDLDKFLTIFKKNSRFSYENLDFSNLKKVLNRDSQKASFTKF